MKRCSTLCCYLVLVSLLANLNTTRADDGWQAQVDQLLLAPKISQVGVGNIFYYEDLANSSEEFGTLGSDLDYSQRVSVGYEGAQGGGAQIRWFSFDQDLQYTGQALETPPVTLVGSTNLDVDAIDVEFIQRGAFRVWDILGTAGVRYGRLSLREQDINFEDLIDTIWFGSTGVDFEGAGPTISLQGKRRIGTSGVSLFGNGRTALLFGDTERFSAFRTGGSYLNPDDVVQVWEVQVGSRFERSMDTIDLFGGIFWEAQRWDSESNLLGDLSFNGFGVTTGIRY